MPATVQKLFKEVFGKAISPTESDYWKQRARTDERTASTLRGAMQLQKSQGGTMAVPVLCPRATPYPLTPEIKDALNVIQKGLLSQEPWKSKLPLKQFENCLDIRFVSDSSQQDSGVTASFWPRTSKSTDLKITLAPRLKSSGHVVLGQTLAHELTHVWQFEQYTEQQLKNPAFKNYKYPTCYDGEAEAIWTEISYLRSLAAANDPPFRTSRLHYLRISPELIDDRVESSSPG